MTTPVTKINNNTARRLTALLVSDGWWIQWQIRKKLHSKALAIVVYDRILNGENHGRS